MNRCEEVLAKKKNPFRCDENLRHSETYMGVEFSEDLIHWKYIDRYKNSKGKWTYVYANKKTHGAIQSAKGAYERQIQKSQVGANTYVWPPERTKRAQTYYDQYQSLLDKYKIGKNRGKYSDMPEYIAKDVNKRVKKITKDISKRTKKLVDSISKKAEKAAYKLTDKAIAAGLKFTEGYIKYKLNK